jgi:hypothetical protein
MNQTKLVKRDQIPQKKSIVKKIPTVVVVKEWINTRHQSTKQNAREAFDLLFSNSQKPCAEC